MTYDIYARSRTCVLMVLKEIECGGVEWSYLAEDGVQEAGSC